MHQNYITLENNNQKSKHFQEKIKEKYTKLRNNLTKEFKSDAVVDSNYSNIARFDPEIFERSSIWQPNESTSIELYVTISNFYQKKGKSTINPVHRIRLYIRNKESSPLNSKRLNDLNSRSKRFFHAMENGKFEISRELLVKYSRSEATDEMFKDIFEHIGSINDFELSKSEIITGPDGNQYTILNYTISKNRDKCSTENFKVCFNKENEIVSIR